jgi:hypothetical protein
MDEGKRSYTIGRTKKLQVGDLHASKEREARYA